MRILAIISLCLFQSLSYASDSYLCSADQAAGIIYTKNHWQASILEASRKYVVSKSGSAWSVKELGQSAPFAQCHGDINNLRCNGNTGLDNFYFKGSSLRFLFTYSVGYWNGVDLNTDNPQVEIGRCSPS